jgi:transcriptional regulator with XRE-family HTH domain
MLREAIDAKKRELRAQGHRYSQRELAREAGVAHTYVSLVMKGKRRPTPEVLRDFAHALDPYFPLDQALVAAEHMPQDGELRGLIQTIVGSPKRQWAQVAQEWITRHQLEAESNEQG